MRRGWEELGGKQKVCPPPQALMVVLESRERRELSRVWVIFLFAKFFRNFFSCIIFLASSKVQRQFFHRQLLLKFHLEAETTKLPCDIALVIVGNNMKIENVL
jgi:hypothetical protein